MKKRKLIITGPVGKKTRRVDFIVGDSKTFHASVDDADFIVVEFGRKQVEAGLTGDAVDRLMLLSDSLEYVNKFKSEITFSFAGYDSDKREIYEIPECVNFLRKVTENWPYWLHFAETRANTVKMLVLMLSGSTVVERKDGMVGSTVNAEEFGNVLNRLFHGMNELHETYGISEDVNKELTHATLAAIERDMG